MGFIRRLLKELVAGDELETLARYREACRAIKEWDQSDVRITSTVKWIERHAESMQSEMGRSLHLMIGKRLHEVNSINN